jgi:hypothetical protein
MSLDLEWEPPLQARWGAPERLAGIRVFHDFDWLDLFPDERTHFRNGRVLAQTVQAQCPEGLTPALLLTRRTDVRQGFVTSGDHWLCVINIDEYRRTPGNPALSYVANHLDVDVSQLHEFTDLADLGDPDAVRNAVEAQLDLERVAEWIRADDQRLRQLLEVLPNDPDGPFTVEQALDSLNALGTLNEEQIQRLVEFTVRTAYDEHRADLVRGVTTDEAGRRITSAVLHERITERISDARRALTRYNELLEDSNSTETDMQNYLASRPLLFGLDYANVRPQTSGPSGSMDFILERFDGYNDLVELKSPADRIINAPAQAEGRGVPSPHSYRLSTGLAQALAQAMAYRDRLSRHASAAEELHGIANPCDPRLIIVLGRWDQLEEHQRHVLLELNRSLHRAEIVPYDLIARRAEAALANVTSLLTAEGPL